MNKDSSTYNFPTVKKLFKVSNCCLVLKNKGMFQDNDANLEYIFYPLYLYYLNTVGHQICSFRTKEKFNGPG